MRNFSALGSTAVLSLFTVVTVLYLALFSRFGRAVLVAVAVGLGAESVVVLKALFGRARPATELAAYPEQGLRFPSDHSSMSAVVFMTIGVLMASTGQRRASPRARLRAAFRLICEPPRILSRTAASYSRRKAAWQATHVWLPRASAASAALRSPVTEASLPTVAKRPAPRCMAAGMNHQFLCAPWACS